MDVQAEVDQEQETVQRITKAARRSPCCTFVDLLWSNVNPIALCNNPGVMFESARRVVVFQEISGELRYYAGGWCLDQNRLYLEQDRMEAEGYELGVFQTIRDALAFSEQYLAEDRDFQTIAVLRQVYYGRWPEIAKAGDKK